MIIEFSLENFRSISGLQTLSFVAAKLKSKNPHLAENNLIPISDGFRLVRSTGIYGANGSGKSNIVKGLMAMLFIVRDSMKDEELLSRIIDPFQLNPEKRTQPSYFQIQFVLEGKKYRYGFEVTRDEIKSEWLAGPAVKNETLYFSRAEQEIQVNKKYFKEGDDLESKTRNTNLFLNVANAFNGPIAKSIKHYLDTQIKALGGANDSFFRRRTLELLENEAGNGEILQFLNLADSGIKSIRQETVELGDRSTRSRVISIREVYDDVGKLIGGYEFDLDRYESEGTRKLFNLSGVLIDTLREGCLFVIDEFDARFHPLLSRKIVELFHDPEINRKGAQLLFVTHDTNLLDKDLLRRDQIYFTEKDSKGQTRLYSLYDFKGVRNDAAIEKNYIQGKYGAIPFLGDFNHLFHVE